MILNDWQCVDFPLSIVVQAAYEASEEEVSLSAMGRMYTIDFAMMQQINEETGTTRPVFRSTDSNCMFIYDKWKSSVEVFPPDQ